LKGCLVTFHNQNFVSYHDLFQKLQHWYPLSLDISQDLKSCHFHNFSKLIEFQMSSKETWKVII
jgi:hypothetical protein